jgi:hypothetical protein
VSGGGRQTACRRLAGLADGQGRPIRLWSCTATWRSGYAAACKAVYTGSIPVVALENPCKWAPFGPSTRRRSSTLPELSPQAVYTTRFLCLFAGDLSGARLVDSSAGPKAVDGCHWARDRRPDVDGRACLSSWAGTSARFTRTLALPRRQHGGASRLALPTMQVVRTSDAALLVAGWRGGRRPRSRPGGSRRSRR